MVFLYGVFMERIKKIFRDILFFKELLRHPRTKCAYQLAKRELFKLLLKIKPKVLKGNLIFGTGDPATTGEILGVVAAFYGLYPTELQIIPDFEEKRLEGHLQAKGRIRLIHVLISAILLLKDKNIRYVYLKMKSKEGTQNECKQQ